MKADVDISSEAFSAVYDEYEQLSLENFIDISRRETIRNHVEKHLKPHGKILEINAGSGIDALYFSKKGCNVLATDISEESGKHINRKIQNNKLENLRFERHSFTALGKISEKFDYIFSNFGGLNCTENPEAIFSQFPGLLNDGGFVSLVIMPKYYPWEILTALKGNKNAFRRWKKSGSEAIVGDEKIRTFYYSPNEIKSAMPKGFEYISTHNIGTFYPSAHFTSLQKYQKLIKKLVKFDHFINRFWVMPKGIGDYFVITFQKV